jgi:hypothetical protein
MKNRLLIFAVLFFVNKLNAQEEVYYIDENDTNAYVVFVPFEDKMYLSDVDIDIDLASHNKFNISQLKSAIKRNLSQEMAYQIKSRGNVLTFEEGFEKQNKDLNMFYSSITYVIDKTVIKEKSNTESQNPIKDLRKKNEITETEVFFTNSKVDKPDLFYNISSKYNAKYFVMINQIDMRKARNTKQEDIQMGNYNRELKINYTIFDKNGEQIFAGASFSIFPNTEKSVSFIVAQYAKEAIKEISNNVPSMFLPVGE